MLLDMDAVEFLSREEGIDPAFIEKDWHAVRVLGALSRHSHEGVATIFTGGTSLSKGHGLIQRFSEDLDFRARISGGHSTSQLRKLKSAFRSSIIETLRNIEGISFVEEDLVVDGLGFKVQLVYQKVFEAPDGIRAELQVEFSYTQPRLDPEYRPIKSMIAQYKGDPGETGIQCLSPVEIAADKFSSLIWRVNKRDRSDPDDEPVMLRHLHDLCALKYIIESERAIFSDTALASFATDQERANRQVGMGLKDAADKALELMRGDELYQAEYERFVDAMSYAADDERIAFSEAIAELETLTAIFVDR